MSDDNPTPEAPAADGGQPPAGTPEAPAAQPPAGDPAPTPSEHSPEVQKLIDEAAAAARREANREAKSLRDRAKAAEEELRKRKDAELSESERLQKERDDAVAKAAELEQTARAAKVGNALERAARAAGFADPTDALTLSQQITVDDDGNPVGVEEAVKALAAAKPHYLTQPGAPQLDPNNPGRQPAPQLTPQEQTQQLMTGRTTASVWDTPPAA